MKNEPALSSGSEFNVSVVQVAGGLDATPYSRLAIPKVQVVPRLRG